MRDYVNRQGQPEPWSENHGAFSSLRVQKPWTGAGRVKQSASLFNSAEQSPGHPRLQGPRGTFPNRQGAVNTSPGLRRSAPQVHGAPPECSCPSQTGSSRGHQMSPRDAVPTPGRCCLSQGRHCTLSQGQKGHLCVAAVDTEPGASGLHPHSL